MKIWALKKKIPRVKGPAVFHIKDRKGGKKITDFRTRKEKVRDWEQRENI